MSHNNRKMGNEISYPLSNNNHNDGISNGWTVVPPVANGNYQRSSSSSSTAILNEGGNQVENLAQHYTRIRDEMRSIICSSIPELNGSDVQVFMESCKREMDFRNDTRLAKHALDKAVKHDTSPEVIAQLKENLKLAEDGLKQAEAVSFSSAMPLLDALDSDEVIGRGGTLDDVFVSFKVLHDAQPDRLAKWSDNGKNKARKFLVDQLLGDLPLMRDMLLNGGAKDGNYGDAMLILSNILKTSAHAAEQRSGIFYCLALGTSLEHSSPMYYFDTSTYIRPVERYLEYEKAYLNEELDPLFENMSAWECRWITNSDAPNDQAAWMRRMLGNYRPDLVLSSNYDWRYCQIVRTDVRYKVPEWTSRPKTYQQLISGGGKCGPRAWFGRFATRSFGIPSWGIRQPGHAAMTHWTPHGWCLCLGGQSRENLWGGWHTSWWGKRNAFDFLAEAEARMNTQADYMKVIRMQCLSVALGETDCSIFDLDGFWGALAIMQQKAFARDFNESKEVWEQIAAHSNKEKWSKRTVSTDSLQVCPKLSKSSIIIDPSSIEKIRGSGNNVVIMKSFENGSPSLHGQQVLLRADGRFKFTVKVAESKSYLLSAYVVTVHAHQHPLNIEIHGPNNQKSSAKLAIPYTVGEWQVTTEPSHVFLTKGTNDLMFTRERDSHGVAFKRFELVPVVVFD